MGADAWNDARESVAKARGDCLAVIANHYCHPVEVCAPEVLAAVAAAIRAGFDMGVEFTHRKSTIPPPPPQHDPPCEALPSLPQHKLPGALAVSPLALGAGQNSSSGDDQ